MCGQRMVAEGMVAGVPDVNVAIPCRGWPGLYIEFKRKPNKLTIEQDFMLEAFAYNGYKTAVCWSCQEAIDTVLDYLGADIRAQIKVSRPY